MKVKIEEHVASSYSNLKFKILCFAEVEKHAKSYLFCYRLHLHRFCSRHFAAPLVQWADGPVLHVCERLLFPSLS